MSSATNALLGAYAQTPFSPENQERSARMQLYPQQARQMQAQTALAQQETQGKQIQNQLAAQSLRDNQIIQQAYADTDPDFWKDPASTQKFSQKLQDSGISYPGLANWNQFHTQQETAYADLIAKDQANQTNRLKYEMDQNEATYNLLQGYKDTKDAQKPQYWAQVVAPKMEALHPGHQYDPNNPLMGDVLDAMIGMTGSQKAIAERKKAESEVVLQTAQAAKDKEETRRAKLANDMLEKSQQGGDPAELTGGVHPIRSILQGIPENDPALQGFVNWYDQGSKMPVLENGIARYPQREKAMEAAGNYLETVQEANSSQIRAGKVQTRKEEAAAVAPIEEERQVNAAVRTEVAKAALSPDLFNAIIDPTARNKAINDWSAAEKSYREEEAGAHRLQAFVQAARSGNQTAAAQIPISELRSIVSRVTNQELETTGNGLSIARRIQNVFDKGLTGKPSDETLKDFEDLSNIMLGSAKDAYSGKMMPLRKQGAKVPLVPDELTQQAAPAPGTSKYKAGDTKVVNGKTYKRDATGTWTAQ